MVRRLAHWASLVLVVGSLGVLAVVGVGPRSGRYNVATVLSASMRPNMPPGSLVVITPMPPERLRVGDVVMYQIPVDDHRVVSHRIVEITEPGPRPVIRTKGDANDLPDPWLARLDGGQAWRVRAAIPKAGFVVQALRGPQARLVATYLVPALLAFVWLWGIWRPRDPDPASAVSTLQSAAT